MMKTATGSFGNVVGVMLLALIAVGWIVIQVLVVAAFHVATSTPTPRAVAHPSLELAELQGGELLQAA